MTTRNEGGGGDGDGGGLPTPSSLSSLIQVEIVTERVALTTDHVNDNMMVYSSHDYSLSSRDDRDDDDDDINAHDGEASVSYDFPTLRRVGSFPLTTAPATPPRRPRRCKSFERQGSSRTLYSDDDEIDHCKFRKLLLGTSDSDVAVKGDAVDEEEEQATMEEEEEMTLMGSASPLRPRKSCCSAPPKIPNRVGSDSEKITAADRQPSTGSIPVGPALGRINRDRRRQVHRQSLPATAFRPRPVHNRRRRQRSLIQEMLTPDSEGSSKSLRLPPKLPSRSESETSVEGVRRPSFASIGNRSIPSSVLCSVASTASSSQKSIGSTDAPKRPRRSLSPIFAVKSLSLLEPTNTSTQPSTAMVTTSSESSAVRDGMGPTDAASKTTTPTTTTAATTTGAHPAKTKKKKKVLSRAKTFSFHYDSPRKANTTSAIQINYNINNNNNSCIAMLAKNWEVGRDLNGRDLLQVGGCSSSSSPLPIKSDKWPKPRRTKVAPGRSRTFSFFVKPHFQLAHGDPSDATSVVSRCA